MLLCLLLVLHDLRGDPIHVSGSFLCQSLSGGLLFAVFTLVLDQADETGIFELLQAVSDDLASALVVLGWANTASLLATVVGLEGGDSNLASDVKLVSNGGSSDVKPVAVVWSKILVTSSLNVLGPLHRETSVYSMVGTYVWHLDLVALLKVLGEGIDEFFSGHILYGNSTTGVDSRKLNL